METGCYAAKLLAQRGTKYDWHGGHPHTEHREPKCSPPHPRPSWPLPIALQTRDSASGYQLSYEEAELRRARWHAPLVPELGSRGRWLSVHDTSLIQVASSSPAKAMKRSCLKQNFLYRGDEPPTQGDRSWVGQLCPQSAEARQSEGSPGAVPSQLCLARFLGVTVPHVQAPRGQQNCLKASGTSTIAPTLNRAKQTSHERAHPPRAPPLPPGPGPLT